MQRKYYSKQRRDNYKIRKETKNISIARDHLTKEEIKEYSILYIMYNFVEIIMPRFEILKEVVIDILSDKEKKINYIQEKMIKYGFNHLINEFKTRFKDYRQIIQSEWK